MLVKRPSASTRVSGRVMFPVHTEPLLPAAKLNSCSSAGGNKIVFSAVVRSLSRPEFVPTQTLPSRSTFRFQIAFELSPSARVVLSPAATSTVPFDIHFRSSNLETPLSTTAHREPSGVNAKSPKRERTLRGVTGGLLRAIGGGPKFSRRSPISSESHIDPSGPWCRNAG